MSKELIERLRKHWTDCGSPTDRDAEFDQGIMAIDCNEAAARIEQLEAIVEMLEDATAAMNKSNPFPWHTAMAAADCDKPGYDDTCSIEDANGVCVVSQMDDEYSQLLLNLVEAAAESARAKEPTHAD